MRNVTVALLLVTLGCVSTLPPEPPAWLVEPQVTLYRLRGYRPGQKTTDGAFHGLEVVESRTISPGIAAALVETVRAAWLRQQQEEVENRRTGKVGGGVWGCVSGELGVRFVSSHQTVDFLLHCDLWLDSIDPRASRERVVFTEAEGREFRRTLDRGWQ